MSWDGYQSKRWRKVRARILRRDGYMCREAKRYGKAVEATTVHHVWPAEAYPEYAWCDWNLLSLSGEAHDAMHDRLSGKLTALGQYWQRKTSPPGSGGEKKSPPATGGGDTSDGGKTGGGGKTAGRAGDGGRDAHALKFARANRENAQASGDMPERHARKRRGCARQTGRAPASAMAARRALQILKALAVRLQMGDSPGHGAWPTF